MIKTMWSKALGRLPRWALIGAGILFLLLLWGRFAPMAPLFDAPNSTVLLDRMDGTLGATVASDGQWRMPSTGPVPERFERCLLVFEDRHFHDHWGIHVPSLYRAWQQNRKAGRVVSGGSTITMQLARMARGQQERSIAQKLLEMALALRIELRQSKSWILRTYADHAPFGGNVVGLEAAAWRWFGRPAGELSWAESATLAVLPNAPARMHPGRGREALRKKRDRLLGRLLVDGTIDSTEWSLALDEPLPDRPLPFPKRAPHLLDLAHAQGLSGELVRSTIDPELQVRTSVILSRHADRLKANEVHNAAALVLDIRTGEVLAYVGNMPATGNEHAEQVDITQARRSTGSLLKPLLYASMLRQGELMPDQLVADLPTQFDGFVPRNFEDHFDGAVPASMALARSLNVPAVRALRSHGIERTLGVLRSMGLTSIDRSADHYGLALMMGGAESTLWELTGAYASLVRILLHATGELPDEADVVHPPRPWRTDETEKQPVKPSSVPLDAASVHHTLQALQLPNRPESERGWEHFGGVHAIAWKTGTSFGHRDAWAIGVSSRYAVGVWVGNANGEGRPGLTGTLAAAPILFDLINGLPEGAAFPIPHDGLTLMGICRASGHRAGPDCPMVDDRAMITAGLRTPLCPYHRPILVNAAGTLRVAGGPGSRRMSWFVLPPAMEHYYMRAHPEHRLLPPWEGLPPDDGDRSMELIYPEQGSTLLLPVQLDGTPATLVMHAAHRTANMTLYWALNGDPVGMTTGDHRLALPLGHGRYQLTLTDRTGRSMQSFFTIVSGKERN
jgi:penicillin-binding protein 1C